MDVIAPFNVTPAIALTGSDMPGGGATIAIGATGQIALDGTEVDSTELLSALRS